MMCVLLVSVTARAQTRPYRGTFQSVRGIILRLENRSATFRSDLENWTSRNPNDVNAPAANENIAPCPHVLRDFDESVRRLHDRFDARQSTRADVQDVLNRASRIDVFMRRQALNARTQNDWSSMRVDLNQLASAYNVRWTQATNTYPPINTYPPTNNYPTYGNNRYGYGAGLTGTYRLDVSRSDDARAAADRATRDLARSERNRVMDSVTRRLEAPDQLALDVRGQSVTIASTRAAQISFVADGRERVETNGSGRTVRSRATVNGDQLMVSTTGDRGNAHQLSGNRSHSCRRAAAGTAPGRAVTTRSGRRLPLAGVARRAAARGRTLSPWAT